MPGCFLLSFFLMLFFVCWPLCTPMLTYLPGGGSVGNCVAERQEGGSCLLVFPAAEREYVFCFLCWPRESGVSLCMGNSRHCFSNAEKLHSLICWFC